ncbi:GTPase HflX [Nitrosomonadaceae bacterium]|nr:GTPase HflX [Nitrosospira sp.]MDW7642418.1 GTPase HflX [Nitrosomonadaceae bacterium]MBI0407751.1 GTPase HflX [Nitrosospira sp.]MBI0419047.1 GTPase HflX [Nitrosospira sp.]MDW7652959.1 GTPase HflX [Nitrosomonadaceae bacterium]
MSREIEGQPKCAVVASVQLPGASDKEFEASLSELSELAKTLGYQIIRTFTQKRSSFDTKAYLGAGKRREISNFINNESDKSEVTAINPNNPEIDVVLIDHEISPSQARNLENEIGCGVMDRTMIILEIFHRNAKSRAARAQVEIARLGYMAPRLREAAKLAGPQGRQRSGVGGRGGGESYTELDRRKIRDRIAELQQEIVIMDAERKTQRARRQGGQGLFCVALVGYTNAGKSTLMRALTGSDALVANKLFATLDTTVRALYPESMPRVLVSDTVGFIKNLPHGLVVSFKSTLDEVLDASLLLHIIDAGDPEFERQLAVTDDVLKEIGANAVPCIRIFNKIDQVGNETMQADREKFLREKYSDCIVMSAYRPNETIKLHQTIIAFFQKNLLEVELFLPWSAQQLRGKIYANCQVIKEYSNNEGAFFLVRGEFSTVNKLREQFSQIQ